MFQKILLPVDLSDRHQQALQAAAELALQSRGEVVLLHVIEVIPGLSGEDDFYSRLERVARKHMEALKANLDKKRVPSRVEILFGNRGQEIVQWGRKEHTDLVVLSAPVIDPDNPALSMGSLSYKVGIFAPCAVLLVR
jgi:nucleotide-binding universal stress UspA family protein